MRQAYKDKVVVVTGAGRGLGAALCKQFGKAGAYIVGCDINQSNLDNLSVELAALSIPHYLATCDVSDKASVASFFTAISDKKLSIHTLINNAGITNIKLFSDNTNEEIERVMQINFFGAMYCTRAAYKDVVQNKGSFIAISSVAGFSPLYGRTAYAASKHAVIGFFETLRSEVAAKDVHVLVACPGFIATKLRDQYYKKDEDVASTKHKVGDNASPEEVAALIYKATIKKQPMLVTGIGKLSYWLKRLIPFQYEKMMTRKMQQGFE